MVWWQVFKHFFLLGWVSFGGPAAHLGYFQKAFVEKLGWLSNDSYARLVALSQFLPGPGSSQVGFAIGYRHAGIKGAIAAFVGFTLPSFLLMAGLAIVGNQYLSNQTFNSVIYGLKLLAVVVVADAVITMGKSFCQHWYTRIMALLVTLVLVFYPTTVVQVLLIAIAALVGYLLVPKQSLSLTEDAHQALGKKAKSTLIIGLISFLGLLLLPLVNIGGQWQSLFSIFYQAGSLVFGGGHVVLPLLQQSMQGMISQDQFLMGYAAAQAVPGPMFTFATFLGAVITPNAPVIGAIIATVAVFLPGFILVLALQNHWHAWASNPKISGAMQGINTAVVGLLMAALYHPIFSSAVQREWDLFAVVIGFLLIRVAKVPILILVLTFMFAGVLLTQYL